MKLLGTLCAALMTTACGLSFNPDLPADGDGDGVTSGAKDPDDGGIHLPGGEDGDPTDPCTESRLAEGGAGGQSHESSTAGLGGECGHEK